MTRNATRTRPQRRADPDRQIYLPHSSWTRADPAPAAKPAIAPDDFWERLGL